MADITMCDDNNCPLRESCYRFNAPVNEWRQSYFAESPNKNNDDKCPEYWFRKDDTES